ncbi:helix-turn-helix domain-containing protein [Kitasatospora sp. NBC_00240]|uniref:helix-turn-helix domain-containing protein n=1 Tax=Kitasatospora sp. NBC_00240 TaxID=2903567 RepID=UPI00224D4766|nr:helix-turn-helix transcriptional regulator [Kitasatospora sp. NBC_00240]MCX5209703.1 helix-turn-helix domain-containing protein [Kitasatospora sp. NBC_00240]
MTIADQYAAWLQKAMREAGLEIDRQRGGGRTALAQAVNVSPSTVARWLDAKSTPSPELFEPIADAVGADVGTMLIESGIISAGSLPQRHRSDVRSQPNTPAQAADALGITDPVARAAFMRDLAIRNRRHLRSADPEGEAGGAVAQ